MQFQLDADEQEKLHKWDEEHRLVCKLREARTAIGGRLTYSFTPTSIGTVVTVDCACKAKIDLTDYASW